MGCVALRAGTGVEAGGAGQGGGAGRGARRAVTAVDATVPANPVLIPKRASSTALIEPCDESLLSTRL